MAWRLVLWGVRLVILAVVVSFVTMASATFYFSSRGLEPALDARADVIIVLSAGLDRDYEILDNFSRDRVATAVELWRRGRAPKILMSGGVDVNTDQHVGERMKAMAISLGVPAQAIVIEGFSTSTFENARFTLRVAREEGWRTAIVVTDDFHLLRARALFEVWRIRDQIRNDIEIVALAPALGRQTASYAQSIWMLGRETLSYPYNVGKVALQFTLDLAGMGEGRTVR